MKKSFVLLSAIALAVLTLTGCGKVNNQPHPDNLSSIIISETGEVRYDMGGVLDQSYYNIDELVSMARQELSEFNSQVGGTPASLGEYLYDPASGQVFLPYTFSGAGYCEKLTGTKVFYGTVTQASLAGFDISGSMFTSVKGGSIVSGSEIYKNNSDRMVIVTNLRGAVMGPYAADYVSDGIFWVSGDSGDYCSTMNYGGDYAIIILKQ